MEQTFVELVLKNFHRQIIAVFSKWHINLLGNVEPERMKAEASRKATTLTSLDLHITYYIRKPFEV